MIKRLGLLIAGVTATGCATMSPEECLQANWEEVGYNDGAAGYPVDRKSVV